MEPDSYELEHELKGILKKVRTRQYAMLLRGEIPKDKDQAIRDFVDRVHGIKLGGG